MLPELGRILLIANPVAHSGHGLEGAQQMEELLKRNLLNSRFTVVLTQAPGDATALAATATEFDTVLALGGDGVIHEVVNGLMTLPADLRPQLGIIPLGSGNDYARTLSMSKNNVEKAFYQLKNGCVRNVDVGKVNDSYFMQTLSFGLDAAIALDTTERRARNSSQKGEALFFTSGLKILSHAGKSLTSIARFDDMPPQRLETLIFTVQLGPTYGGGFRICPEADITDGYFDVCRNVTRPALPHILMLFLLARAGLHTHSKVLEFMRVRTICLDFDEVPPCQADGEELVNTHFEISLIPDALRVISAQ